MEILLVEPNAKERKDLALALSSRGHKVTEVAGGWIAQKTLQLFRYDVIICATIMPGVTGVNIISELRAAKDDTIFIFIDSEGYALNKQIALTLGANAYLVKPIDVNYLSSVLNYCFSDN